jgi:Na+-driven multidrug efflux pump
MGASEPALAPQVHRRVEWLRWLAASLGLLLGLFGAVLLVVLAVDALTGWSGGEAGEVAAGYLYLLLYLPFTWPLHLAVVALAARRAHHPRRWALASSPLLGLPLALVLPAVTSPPVAGWWLLFVAYGVLVRLPTSTSPDS